MQPQEGVAETNDVSGAEAADVHTPDETTQLLRYLAQNSITKEDLKNFATKDDLKELATKDDLKELATKDDMKKEVKASEQRMMDYTDKRMTEAENKFIMPLHREDEKVDAVIESAQQRKLFNKSESGRLQSLGPFSNLVQA